MVNSAQCHLCALPLKAGDVLWLKDGLEIAKCPQCGLVQRAELPTASELDAIYAKSYFVREASDTSGQGYLDYLSEAREHRINARRRLVALQRRGASTGDLLDVGGAAGFFADEARLLGWRVQGLDVSPEMTDYARNELDLDFTATHFRHFEADRAYDVITMWDYIEHSADPVGDLKRAAQLLRPGGLLALSTGDIETLVGRLSGRRWHLMTPRHHNFFFSARTLEVALRGAGLEVQESRHRAGYFSVGYLVHKVRTMFSGGRLLDRLADRIARGRLGSVAMPVSLGDVVTIFARKPE
jgi:SAM-dependent methyltransferase